LLLKSQKTINGNSNIYFLKISSKDKSKTELYDLLDLETTYNLSKGDVINLRNKSYSANLEEDFKTFYFEIVGRMFISDDDNENNGGVMTLVIEPYFVK